MKKIILMMVVFSFLLLANSAILSIDTGGHTAMIKKNLIVSKSGDIISASDDKSIRVWDRDGKEKRKILGQIGAGVKGQIFAIALSSDEKYLAVGGYFTDVDSGGGAIRLYDYQSGKLLNILKSHTDVVNDLSFSSDGKYLVSGSFDQTVKIWDIDKIGTDALASAKGGSKVLLPMTISFHTHHVYAVKFTDENHVISAGYDNRIALHDTKGKMIGKPYTHNEKLSYIATNGKTIATCGYGNEILLFDTRLNLQSKIKSETVPMGLSYSPDARFLIAGTGGSPYNVNVYDSQNGYSKIATFDKHTNGTQAVAFLDNQTAVSGGGNNNEIYIWDIKSKEVKTKIVGAGQSVWINEENIAWGNIGMTQINQHTQLQKSFNLKSLEIGTDASGSAKGGTKVPLPNFKRINSDGLSHSKGGDYGYSHAVLNIASSNTSITKDDNTGYKHNCYGWYKGYIISGGMNGQLKIYDKSGNEVASLLGHTGEIWSIALDGDRLVSGSSDQTIKVWDLKSIEKIVQLEKEYDENVINKVMTVTNWTKKEVIERASFIKKQTGVSIYKSKILNPTISLFMGSDNEWVIWTPQGYFNASKDGAKYIGYHINQGSDKEAEFLDISRFRKDFYRPDIVIKAIDGEDISSFVVDIDKILQNRAGGLPPEVKILTSSRSVEQDETTIGVKVCDKGGGSENLSFYIDDKPVQYLSQTRAFREKKEMVGGCIVLEQKLAIPYGEHNISFNATNKSGDIGSNTDKIKITNKKAQISKPNLHILTLSKYLPKSNFKENNTTIRA